MSLKLVIATCQQCKIMFVKTGTRRVCGSCARIELEELEREMKEQKPSLLVSHEDPIVDGCSSKAATIEELGTIMVTRNLRKRTAFGLQKPEKLEPEDAMKNPEDTDTECESVEGMETKMIKKRKMRKSRTSFGSSYVECRDCQKQLLFRDSHPHQRLRNRLCKDCFKNNMKHGEKPIMRTDNGPRVWKALLSDNFTIDTCASCKKTSANVFEDFGDEGRWCFGCSRTHPEFSSRGPQELNIPPPLGVAIPRSSETSSEVSPSISISSTLQYSPAESMDSINCDYPDIPNLGEPEASEDISTPMDDDESEPSDCSAQTSTTSIQDSETMNSKMDENLESKELGSLLPTADSTRPNSGFSISEHSAFSKFRRSENSIFESFFHHSENSEFQKLQESGFSRHSGFFGYSNAPPRWTPLMAKLRMNLAMNLEKGRKERTRKSERGSEEVWLRINGDSESRQS